MITSTFRPNTGNTDDKTFDEMAAAEAVYGTGSDAPQFVVISGEVFPRDPATGDLGDPLVAGAFPAEQRFRRLAGTLDIQLVS